ncbi:uncharacterized protein LOC131539189 [Onychostoma macrolepis]|uniref:uncharacterized protein LOC131539189 n=1 Tax=Onychostoma macrolepis TaxID=369639 RepID=UPI00272AEA63|nr:uncharacterized protein LOC131539189 [Onychostoma macrolepis]
MADKFQTEHNLQAAVVCLDKSESVAHNSLSVSHSVHDEKANPLETESTASKMSLYEEGEEGDVVYYQNQRAASPKPSCVSMKSEQSMGAPIYFSDEAVTFNPRDDQTGDLAFQQPVDDELQRVKKQHRISMKNKYESIFEGIKLEENQTFLNRIYTQLYIIEGESEGVNEEHEVLQMEKTARTQHSQDTPIYCNDIFKASPEPGCEEKDQIKTVLTKGIAGIGKTVSSREKPIRM